jgi:hypothetical protein
VQHALCIPVRRAGKLASPPPERPPQSPFPQRCHRRLLFAIFLIGRGCYFLRIGRENVAEKS